jgi:tRNA G37 N-methylase Trm5
MTTLFRGPNPGLNARRHHFVHIHTFMSNSEYASFNASQIEQVENELDLAVTLREIVSIYSRCFA